MLKLFFCRSYKISTDIYNHLSLALFIYVLLLMFADGTDAKSLTTPTVNVNMERELLCQRLHQSNLLLPEFDNKGKNGNSFVFGNAPSHLASLSSFCLS